jgi:hypothetical protein
MADVNELNSLYVSISNDKICFIFRLKLKAEASNMPMFSLQLKRCSNGDDRLNKNYQQQ